MKRKIMAVVACAVAATGVAAGPGLARPRGADAEASERDAGLESLRRQDLRVASVAFRIVTANVALCPDTGPTVGWVLHDLRQYGPRLREDARRRFGLDDTAPGVLAVVPDGPAAQAGVRPDDVLLALNGQSLAAHGPTSKTRGDYAALEATLARIDAALRSGPAELTVRRAGVERTLALTPVPGCAYDVQLLPGEAMSASADGRHVFITTGMTGYALTDDELAVVLGHEFAHNVLRHKARLDEVGFARGVLGNLGSRPGDLRQAEREADHVGLYLAARAGYEVSGAADFWRRFAADHRAAAYLDLSHPGARERAANLEATSREIEAKRRAGEPLIPAGTGAAASR